MLPHSVSSFDPTRQLARGDVIFFSNLGAPNVVKWSKTIQNRNDIHIILIPNLGKSPLCPCTLLKKELESTSGDSNQPLFTLYRTLGPVPLMDSVGGRHLKQISAILHLTPSLKFHDFRRSDATWAFHNGVSLDYNMHHGTWKSDSVRKYIQSTPQTISPVSSTFYQLLRC